jgi:tetratricopeptide (TPR) repeat protein
MFDFFKVFSLFYVVAGINTIWKAIKRWRELTDDNLTAFDKQQLGTLAFFALVPIAVLLHELGHAAATYQMGGYVDWLNGGFEYGFFFGSVQPIGRFLPEQRWWISLAGNLVSVVLVFLGILGAIVASRPWLKFLFLSFARTQFVLTLIAYPLMSIVGFFGDYVWIYGTSWGLTIPTASVHLALIGGLVLLDRSARVKRWEVSLNAEAHSELQKLDRAIAARPGAPDPLIERGNFYAAQGHPELAIGEYRAALKLDAENPRALYNIGQMRLMQKRYANAEKHFRAALTRSGNRSAGVHYSLALALFHRGKLAEALREFDLAIAENAEVAEFFFWRGTARRATGDQAGARSDFARVLEVAVDNPELVARAKELLR